MGYWEEKVHELKMLGIGALVYGGGIFITDAVFNYTEIFVVELVVYLICGIVLNALLLRARRDEFHESEVSHTGTLIVTALVWPLYYPIFILGRLVVMWFQ